MKIFKVPNNRKYNALSKDDEHASASYINMQSANNEFSWKTKYLLHQTYQMSKTKTKYKDLCIVFKMQIIYGPEYHYELKIKHKEKHAKGQAKSINK